MRDKILTLLNSYQVTINEYIYKYIQDDKIHKYAYILVDTDKDIFLSEETLSLSDTYALMLSAKEKNCDCNFIVPRTLINSDEKTVVDEKPLKKIFKRDKPLKKKREEKEMNNDQFTEVTAFKCSDGKLFENKEDAINHQRKQKKVKSFHTFIDTHWKENMDKETFKLLVSECIDELEV